jgi:hypothetical protein
VQLLCEKEKEEKKEEEEEVGQPFSLYSLPGIKRRIETKIGSIKVSDFLHTAHTTQARGSACRGAHYCTVPRGARRWSCGINRKPVALMEAMRERERERLSSVVVAVIVAFIVYTITCLF